LQEGKIRDVEREEGVTTRRRGEGCGTEEVGKHFPIRGGKKLLTS